MGRHLIVNRLHKLVTIEHIGSVDNVHNIFNSITNKRSHIAAVVCNCRLASNGRWTWTGAQTHRARQLMKCACIWKVCVIHAENGENTYSSLCNFYRIYCIFALNWMPHTHCTSLMSRGASRNEHCTYRTRKTCKKYIYKSLENDRLHVQVHCPLSGATAKMHIIGWCQPLSIGTSASNAQRTVNFSKTINESIIFLSPMSQFNSSDKFDAITCEMRTSFQ